MYNRAEDGINGSNENIYANIWITHGEKTLSTVQIEGKCRR